MRTKRIVSFVASFTVAAASSSTAFAVSTTIPATLGHKSAGATPFNPLTYSNAVYAMQQNGSWTTPLVLSNFQSGDIEVSQYPMTVFPYNCWQGVASTLYTFTKGGDLEDSTSSVAATATGNVIGTATVPTNGSASVETALTVNLSACPNGSQAHTFPSLALLRVTW